jgi:hypothetical protein
MPPELAAATLAVEKVGENIPVENLDRAVKEAEEFEVADRPARLP